MSGPYHRYAPLEPRGIFDGPLEAPDSGHDCVCPRQECCGCGGSKDLCECKIGGDDD